MRFIDADKLKAFLKSNCKPEFCHDYNTNWCEDCCRVNDFEDLIDSAPTVEVPGFEQSGPLPDLHMRIITGPREGEWKINTITGDIFCSRCKRVRRDTRKEHIYYCNHCGARMIKASEAIT